MTKLRVLLRMTAFAWLVAIAVFSVIGIVASMYRDEIVRGFVEWATFFGITTWAVIEVTKHPPPAAGIPEEADAGVAARKEEQESSSEEESD